MKKTVLCSLILTLCLTPLFSKTVSAAPVVTLGSICLVDNGKHLDWDGKSNYLVQFTYAANTWNAYKPGVLRKDTIWIIEDVKISDYAGDNSTILIVKSSGKIMFNQLVMDTHTDAQKKSDCLFAIGIALGLGKTHNSADAMYYGLSSVTSLSPNDKASYDAAFNKY